MLTGTSLCNDSFLSQTFGEKNLRIVKLTPQRPSVTTCLANGIVDLV